MGDILDLLNSSDVRTSRTRSFSGKSGVAVLAAAASLMAAGCSPKQLANSAGRAPGGAASVPAPGAETPRVRPIQGPAIDSNQLINGQTISVELLPSVDLRVYKSGGKLYFEAEGTFSPEAFQALRARHDNLAHELDGVLAQLTAAGARVADRDDETGYFRVWLPYQTDLFRSVRDLRLDRPVLIDPVAQYRDAVGDAKRFRPQAEGFDLAGARTNPESFQGLKELGVLEFVAAAQQDIGGGAVVDGSSVKLGITDTGITFNHPAFYTLDGSRNRVSYMRDFSGEGTVFLPADAPVTLTEEDGKIVLSTEYLRTPRAGDAPALDAPTQLLSLKLQVTEAQKAAIQGAGSTLRVGYLEESVYQGSGDTVDINHNGKLDDRFLVLFIPAKDASPAVALVDWTGGSGDLRDQPMMRDFNGSRDTVNLFAEKVGLSFQTERVPGGEGTVSLQTVRLVGYDPGNHGSHVAGIAAGSRLFVGASETNPLVRGVAYGAEIQMNRVCTNNAGCAATRGLINLAQEAHSDVVNMSLGGLNPFNDGYGVQEAIINRLSQEKNMLFVISAGNSGPGRQTVGSPSTARLSLSVGASASQAMLERQYQYPGTGTSSGEGPGSFMLFFSSRGPTAAGGMKPSLSAPGTQLSSVQLNAAPGARAGLDVYWGTSMAAPSAAGSYAMLLDAARKYNAAHPETPLTTDAETLRRVLMESAAPFDVNRLDPQTGERTQGQYTWMDEGTGLLSLPRAWATLKALRDAGVASAVQTAAGKSVELDYTPIVEMKNPQGQSYDGSRPRSGEAPAGLEVPPAFGAGLYVSSEGTDSFYSVGIARRLPERVLATSEAGELHRQLVASRDEFVLKTVIYGSDKIWLKAGVRDQLDCWDSETAPVSVIGRGAEVTVESDGTGTLESLGAGNVNVCLNRSAIRELGVGDHGALVSAYRKVGGSISPVASFIVPVTIHVADRQLANSTGYESPGIVKSFQVARHYIQVPTGTSVVRVTLEVPDVKRDRAGRRITGASCSGVELMALEGDNSAKMFGSRAEARASNCDAHGNSVPPDQRKLTVVRTTPKSGLWDLHVFGSYRFPQSEYRIKVDYITGQAEPASIAGGVEALNGSVKWKLASASVPVTIDTDRTKVELRGIESQRPLEISSGRALVVADPISGAQLRSFPNWVKTVTLRTSGAPGSDLDMTLLRCVGSGATSEIDPRLCSVVGASAGSTDVETISFKPVPNSLYVIRIDPFELTRSPVTFQMKETYEGVAERGEVSVRPASEEGAFDLRYEFGADFVSQSHFLTSSQVRSGKFDAIGAITIQSTENLSLGRVPLRVRNVESH